MSTDSAEVRREPKLAHEFRTMPKWKVGLLIVSLVIGVLGVGASIASKNLHKAQPQVTVTRTTTAAPGSTGSTPGGSSGFVGGGASAPDAQTTTNTTTATGPAPATITDWLSPKVATVGFSFFVGLIVGTIARAFLKIATLLAGLAVAAVAAAHYFNINLDLASVQAQAGHATTWIQGQMTELWGVIREHLPSAGTGTAGFLFGMKRR